MAALLVMVIGSANFNNNMGFLLAFLLAGVCFVSAVRARTCLKGATLAFARAEPVFAGGAATLVFGVRANTGRLVATLRPGRVEQSAPGVDICVNAGEEQLVEAPVWARRRGVLKRRFVELTSSYPLGLFEARAVFDVDAQCLVYPAPHPGDVDLPQARVGEAEGDAPGPGVDDFKGIRPYAPGDPLQRIAWKASSRASGLLVKEFQGWRGGGVDIDMREVPGVDVEHRLSLMCKMVLEAQRRGLDFGLSTPQRAIAPASGEGHVRQCLEHLALFGAPDMAGGDLE